MVALAIGLVGGLAVQANAAIYWVNSDSIGRMNLDGTNPSPGLIFSYSRPLRSPCGLAVDGSHLYWAERANDSIGRSNLDGNDREYGFISGADEPCGVAVDSGHVYWANEGGNSIGRASLNGTDVEQEFVPEVTHPCGVAVNDEFLYWAGYGAVGYVGRALRAGGNRGPNVAEFGTSLDYGLCGVAADDEHVYWGGFGDAIGRVGVDGSDPQPRFITGVQSPCSIAIGDGRLYFGEISQWWSSLGHISRANLDGSGVERELVTGLKYPCGIAVDSLSFGPAYVAPPPLLPWTPCSIEEVRVNKWNGSALVRLNGPAYGDFHVAARGLRSRILSKPPPSTGGRQASWRWWIRIWPGGPGPTARHLRKLLVRDGRLALELRVACSQQGSVTNHSSRRLILHKALHRVPAKHRGVAR